MSPGNPTINPAPGLTATRRLQLSKPPVPGAHKNQDASFTDSLSVAYVSITYYIYQCVRCVSASAREQCRSPASPLRKGCLGPTWPLPFLGRPRASKPRSLPQNSNTTRVMACSNKDGPGVSCGSPANAAAINREKRRKASRPAPSRLRTGCSARHPAPAALARGAALARTQTDHLQRGTLLYAEPATCWASNPSPWTQNHSVESEVATLHTRICSIRRGAPPARSWGPCGGSWCVVSHPAQSASKPPRPWQPA